MPQYIDFYLSENRYTKLIECLEEYCEKSDDFYLKCARIPRLFKVRMNCTE